MLEPGIYRFFDLNSEVDVVMLPTTAKLLSILNQEVLTSDNIALRFSYIVECKINGGQKFLSTFDVFQGNFVLYEAEQLIHNFKQRLLLSHPITIGRVFVKALKG